MKKIFSALEENADKRYLYQCLCVKKGDIIKSYWSDCVIDAIKIENLRQAGITKFIIIFRRNGAEMCYKGYNLDIFQYYRKEKDGTPFLLDYDTGSIFTVSWPEAAKLLGC